MGDFLSSVIPDVRVLVVGHDPLARAGLATLLSGQAGCVVVGQAAGDGDLAHELAVYRPDAIVWDLGWAPSATLESLADVEEPHPPLVVLLPEESYAGEAGAAGARGLLLRNAGAGQLVAAARAVVEGLIALDPALAGALLPSGQGPHAPLVEELTAREREVLQLLAEGLSNKAIAGRLGISEHTVKFHVNAIMGKLSAQSRTDAVVRATRLGLLLL